MTMTLSFAQEETTTVSVDNFQKTDEVLAEVIKKGLELAQKTGEFVIEQAPDLIKQFYAWSLYQNIFFIILGIIIFLIGRYLPYLWVTDKQEYNNDIKFFRRWGNGGAFFGWAVFVISGIVSLIMILMSIYDIMYLVTAPKLYIIEHFLHKI
jgi:hypothetical protein